MPTPVVREILVPAETTVAGLHSILQVAFGWEDRHLYSFDVPIAGIFDTQHFSDDGRPSLWVRLDEIFDEGDRVEYTYDFGDNWVHEIHVIGTDNRQRKKAKLVNATGRAPFEDCGSVPGWHALYETAHKLAEGKKVAGEDREHYEWFLGNRKPQDAVSFLSGLAPEEQGRLERHIAKLDPFIKPSRDDFETTPGGAPYNPAEAVGAEIQQFAKNVDLESMSQEEAIAALNEFLQGRMDTPFGAEPSAPEPSVPESATPDTPVARMDGNLEGLDSDGQLRAFARYFDNQMLTEMVERFIAMDIPEVSEETLAQLGQASQQLLAHFPLELSLPMQDGELTDKQLRSILGSLGATYTSAPEGKRLLSFILFWLLAGGVLDYVGPARGHYFLAEDGEEIQQASPVKAGELMLAAATCEAGDYTALMVCFYLNLVAGNEVIRAKAKQFDEALYEDAIRFAQMEFTDELAERSLQEGEGVYPEEAFEYLRDLEDLAQATGLLRPHALLAEQYTLHPRARAAFAHIIRHFDFEAFCGGNARR